MEKHIVNSPRDAVETLEANRTIVRGLLLPASNVVDGGSFPRSWVMRLLVDSGKRRLALGVLTTAWMMVGRRRR